MASAQENIKTHKDKTGSHLINPITKREIAKASQQIDEKIQKCKGETPRISSILEWINENTRCRISKNFFRRKLVRSDVEILKDREANWMEYCILFYSLARNHGVKCSFDLYCNIEDYDEEDDTDYSVYYISAGEGGKTFTVSPCAGELVAIGGKPTQIIGPAEFLQRLDMLSKLDIFSVMRTTPLMYFAYDDYEIWFHCPRPTILAITVLLENEHFLQIRYIVEKQPASQTGCSIIDYEDRRVLTDSQNDLKTFSSNQVPGFRIVNTDRKDIIGQVRGMVSHKLFGILFGRTTGTIVQEFAAEAKKHYDPMYA